ncbi:MAG: hypothetical protein ACSLFL_09070 [Alphaproteobacteria bacterium]|jgi:hypothetical protein
MTEIYLATEDELSEAVAERLVMDSNKKLRVAVRMGKRGNGYLKRKLPELMRVANSFPVLMLTDLDRIECPPALIAEWSSGRPLPREMLFRVAVREVEAWLLADREAFAAFVGAPPNKIPLNPDSLDDPKQTLLGFVRRYGRREIKADILPKSGSRCTVGLGYNQRLSRFVTELWEPERAATCSDSLARAFERLRNL